MKIGFCMLLWTTSVGSEHRALLEDIKATGYDGVEVPIFGGTPENYAEIAVMLDEIGLERTAISLAHDTRSLSQVGSGLTGRSQRAPRALRVSL